jgi:glycerol-3-phosphate dehydrogenase (NAD(P)+)
MSASTSTDPRVCVVGSGNWGTTLAYLQASAGRDVVLCTRDERRAHHIREAHENVDSLPGVKLPDSLEVAAGYASAAAAEIVVLAVPSDHVRETCAALRAYIDDASAMVSATKGLEVGTGLRVSEVVASELPALERFSVLSGPNLAREIARDLPAAAVLASVDRSVASTCAARLGTLLFRLYTSEDVIGVELGGSLKNVIALAAGICDGLEMGTNGKAAVITRGMAEITRLGVACGADALTFSGLSGFGDLFATCVSPLSRNHFVGEQLGQGRKLADILGGMTMVAEGVHTTRAARTLADRHDVEMPITDQVYAVLFEGKDPRAAMLDLLSRLARDEQTGQPQ